MQARGNWGNRKNPRERARLAQARLKRHSRPQPFFSSKKISSLYFPLLSLSLSLSLSRARPPLLALNAPNTQTILTSPPLKKPSRPYTPPPKKKKPLGLELRRGRQKLLQRDGVGPDPSLPLDRLLRLARACQPDHEPVSCVLLLLPFSFLG